MCSQRRVLLKVVKERSIAVRDHFKFVRTLHQNLTILSQRRNHLLDKEDEAFFWCPEVLHFFEIGNGFFMVVVTGHDEHGAK